MKNKNTFSSQALEKGFSLMEAMIALFILVIMMNITITSFLNLAQKYRLKKAVWEINSCLNSARYRAIFDGIKVRLRIDSRSYTIEIYDENQKKWKKEKECFLDGVTLQANNTPTFHPGGTISNLASIYIFNSWGKYKITTAISGRIKTVPL